MTYVVLRSADFSSQHSRIYVVGAASTAEEAIYEMKRDREMLVNPDDWSYRIGFDYEGVSGAIFIRSCERRWHHRRDNYRGQLDEKGSKG